MIAPIAPAFNNSQKTGDNIIKHTVGRLLDFSDIEPRVVKRWEGAPEED